MSMACTAASPSISASFTPMLDYHRCGEVGKQPGLASLQRLCREAKGGTCVKFQKINTSEQRSHTTYYISGSNHRLLTKPETLVDSVKPVLTSSTSSPVENQAEQRDPQSSKGDQTNPIGGRFAVPPFRGGKVLSRAIKCLVSETAAGYRWSDPGYAYQSSVRGRTASAASLTEVAPKTQSLGTEESPKGGLELRELVADRNGLSTRLATDERGESSSKKWGMQGLTAGIGRKGKVLEDVNGQNERFQKEGGKGTSSPPVNEPKHTGGKWEAYSFSWDSSSSEGPMDLLEMAEGLLRGSTDSPQDLRLDVQDRDANQNGSQLFHGRGLDNSKRAEDGFTNFPSTSYSRSRPHSESAPETELAQTASGKQAWESLGLRMRLRTGLRTGLQSGRLLNEVEKAPDLAGDAKVNQGAASEGPSVQLGVERTLDRGRAQNVARGRTRGVWKREGRPSLGATFKPDKLAETYEGGVGFGASISSAETGAESGTRLAPNAGLEAGLGAGLRTGLRTELRTELRTGLGAELRTGLGAGLRTGLENQGKISALDDELGRFVERLSKVGLEATVSNADNGTSTKPQSEQSASNPVTVSQPFQSLHLESNPFSGSGLDEILLAPSNPLKLANPVNPAKPVNPGNPVDLGNSVKRVNPVLVSTQDCQNGGKEPSLETRPFVRELENEGELKMVRQLGLQRSTTQGSERSRSHELGRAIADELDGRGTCRPHEDAQQGSGRPDGVELEWAETSTCDKPERAETGAVRELERGENGAVTSAELEAAENLPLPAAVLKELVVRENEPLPATAFYDENFLERFRYTRPPPNRNLPLFMDIRNHWTAPEDPMPPPYYPKNCTHEKSGPLPGYPHGRVPRPKPPGPLLAGKRPDFWVVNPTNNRLVVPRAAKTAPRGKLPGVRKLLEGWTGRGCMTREESLGAPLTESEKAELVDGAMRERKEVYLGRDGLTWNMVQLIHTHWRRRPVCKIKCKGIYTVDMPKIMRELERCAGGCVLWQHGGTILLYRGRNYHWKQPPILEPPEDRSAEKKLTQAANPMEDRNPGGMGRWESLQLSKRMNREDPVVWLDKNGYYGGLVHKLRTFFAAPQNDLAVIKCPGFVTGDVVKLALLLKALVPAAVFQCDKERKQRIVLYRNPDWRMPYDELTTLAETDKRPRYSPKQPIKKTKLRRTVMYEELASVAAGQEGEGVWGSWNGLFDAPPSDEQSTGSDEEIEG